MHHANLRALRRAGAPPARGSHCPGPSARPPSAVSVRSPRRQDPRGHQVGSSDLLEGQCATEDVIIGEDIIHRFRNHEPLHNLGYI
jgi:hypothetical protein